MILPDSKDLKNGLRKNLVGVSGRHHLRRGIITTVVISWTKRSEKTAAKAVGQFGKALANLAKKAGPQ